METLKPENYYSFDQVVKRNTLSRDDILQMFRTITTMLSILPASHGELRVKDPKSKQSRRDVCLLSALATLLVRNHEITAVVLKPISAAGNIGVLATACAEDSLDGHLSQSQALDAASHATSHATSHTTTDHTEFKDPYIIHDDDDNATPYEARNLDLAYVAVNNPRHESKNMPQDAFGFAEKEQDAFEFTGTMAEIFVPRSVSIENCFQYAWSHHLFQDHAGAIMHLLSNINKQSRSGEEKLILEAYKQLLYYVIAKSYQKMKCRFQREISTRYIDILSSLKIEAFVDKQMTFTQKDLLFFERLEFCQPAPALNQLYKLIQGDPDKRKPGEPNLEVEYCFTQTMSFEFHQILCHILRRLCQLLSGLPIPPVAGGLPSDFPSDFPHNVDQILSLGLSLTAIAYSSIVRSHLIDLSGSLEEQRTGEQPMSMPEMSKITMEMDGSGNGGRMAGPTKLDPGVVGDSAPVAAEVGDSTGVLNKDEGAEDEDEDVDLVATDHTITMEETPDNKLGWVPLKPWQACLNWLRLMIAHFQATNVLSTFIIKSRPNSMSIEILAFPQARQDDRLMPMSTFINMCFPQSKEEISVDLDITAAEAQAAFERYSERVRVKKRKKTLQSGFGPGVMHCEAAIASLIYSVFHDGYSHGKFDEEIRQMFDGCPRVIGVCKRCCPVCEVLLANLSGFDILASHSNIYSCALPPWLPDNIINQVTRVFWAKLQLRIKKYAILEREQLKHRPGTSGSMDSSGVSPPSSEEGHVFRWTGVGSRDSG